jgi:hypothetical protein
MNNIENYIERNNEKYNDLTGLLDSFTKKYKSRFLEADNVIERKMYEDILSFSSDITRKFTIYQSLLDGARSEESKVFLDFVLDSITRDANDFVAMSEKVISEIIDGYIRIEILCDRIKEKKDNLSKIDGRIFVRRKKIQLHEEISSLSLSINDEYEGIVKKLGGMSDIKTYLLRSQDNMATAINDYIGKFKVERTMIS